MRQLSKVESIAFFLIPGICVFLGFQFLYPQLLNLGWNEAWVTFLCLWPPVILMTVIILYLWIRSGVSFKHYFLADAITWKIFGICISAFLIIQVLELVLSPTIGIMAEIVGYTPPNPFPELFLPNFAPNFPLEVFFGQKTQANYSIVVFWIVWLIPNILGEELLWRGYALPRMKKAWGQYAWLVNGLLWNLGFHFFMRWSMIALLPISLLLPWLASRYKSWWVGIIIHGVGNGLLLALLIPSVV